MNTKLVLVLETFITIKPDMQQNSEIFYSMVPFLKCGHEACISNFLTEELSNLDSNRNLTGGTRTGLYYAHVCSNLPMQ
jgi:hypothetical protein